VYIPLPAVAVSGLVVEEAAWSADGRYLLVKGMDLPAVAYSDMEKVRPVPVIAVWYAGSRKATEMWRGAGSAARIDAMGWMGTAATALASIVVTSESAEPAAHLIRIDARRAGAEDLGVLKPMETLVLSPTSNTAALVAPEPGGATVRAVRPTGALPEAYIVPDVQASAGWSSDGRLLVLAPLAKAGTKGPPTEWKTLDLATGRLGTTKSPPVQSPERPASVSPVRLSRSTATLGIEKTTETVSPLWIAVPLGGKEGYRLINPDVSWWAVSPRNDAVACISRGTLLVTPLVRMGQAEVESARSRALDAVAANNAKQAMLGLIMYAADHDDTWPSGDGDIAATLEPYIKAREVLKDFHYLPPGGKTGDIESPATKAVGWVPAPSGYAVAFADGHVEIRPQLPGN
jgi:prepilin-type processing-associated H-X9-DG protein